MVKSYRNKSKTASTPRKPYEKERIDQEIRTCGEYGLKNKRELWRVQLVLARLRKRARELLTLDANDARRIFEGDALLRRMFKFGLLDKEKENGLDYVLSTTAAKMLERRLQTRVFKLKLAKSIHHARVLIYGKKIIVNNQIVNVPSFMVTVDNENSIQTVPRPEKPGRVARRKAPKAE